MMNTGAVVGIQLLNVDHNKRVCSLAEVLPGYLIKVKLLIKDNSNVRNFSHIKMYIRNKIWYKSYISLSWIGIIFSKLFISLFQNHAFSFNIIPSNSSIDMAFVMWRTRNTNFYTWKSVDVCAPRQGCSSSTKQIWVSFTMFVYSYISVHLLTSFIILHILLRRSHVYQHSVYFRVNALLICQ